jgi:MoxR-like ATPase
MPTATDPALQAVATQAHQAAMQAQADTATLSTSVNNLAGILSHQRSDLTALAQTLQGLADTVQGIGIDTASLRDALKTRPTLDEGNIKAEVTQAVAAAFKPFAATVEAAGAQAAVGAMVAHSIIARETTSKVFGLALDDAKGAQLMADVWDAPNAPSIDPCYIWQEGLLRHLIQTQETGEPLWLGGPKGTGKTQALVQFAARTGRPVTRINFHKYSTQEEYIGATGLEAGSTGFKPGPFLMAYTTPGAVIILDEISNADPGELAPLNGLLEPGAAITIGGQVWRRALGVIIAACDNTLTVGDASGRYAGTREMNAALGERFTRIVPTHYLPRDAEVDALIRHTGCTQTLAGHVIDAIALVRSRVDTGDVIDAPSIRQAVAFIRALRFHSIADAWDTTIAARQPVESAIGLKAVFDAAINPSLILQEI